MNTLIFITLFCIIFTVVECSNNVEQSKQEKSSILLTSNTIENAPPTTECFVCEWLVDAVLIMLQDNKTDQEIIDTLNQSCQFLQIFGESFVETCVIMVEADVPIIIVELETDDPDQVCITLEYCQSPLTSKMEQNKILLRSEKDKSIPSLA